MHEFPIGEQTVMMLVRCRMVNNAGIFCGQHRIAEESVEAFDKTMVLKDTT